MDTVLDHEVIASRRRTRRIVELWLRPLTGALEFVPGQFVLLEDEAGTVQPRSYSIANAPRGDGLISLLVSRVDGGQGSGWIHDRLRVGDHVVVSGPYGTFTLPQGARASWLFLAAGSGLAPFRAMLGPALDTCSDREILLLLSARSEDEVVDHEYLAALEARRPMFSFVTTLTADGPRIPELLPHLYTNLSGTEVFAAGRRAFVEACMVTAVGLGAVPDHVHSEPF